MWRLLRKVRFSVSPFASTRTLGHNAFVSKPTATGLSLFLELGIELKGLSNADTGFVINVRDIDLQVRQHAVPLFIDAIATHYQQQRDVTFSELVDILRVAYGHLEQVFKPVYVHKILLNTNPYTNIALAAEYPEMVYYSEKFEFAAMHKLWNDQFDHAKNNELFGKCANPSGHGHNYIVEVTVKSDSLDRLDTLRMQRVIDDQVIGLLDHTNMNVDVAYFSTVNPTIENIAKYAWQRLVDQFDPGVLHCITIWESDRTSCSYYGEG
jgi:6-pyruvoyltetrahydropterin/6-carboxytetrahydropterin synthase